MTTKKIAQRDFIALEKDLALVYSNDPESIKIAERATERLLSEAKRGICVIADRGTTFAQVLEILLLLDPDPILLSSLGRHEKLDYSWQWTGSLIAFEGELDVFLELYSAVTHLRVVEDSESRRRHGAKGGAIQRNSDVKEDIVRWWNEKGHKVRTNKSGAIEWLIGNWMAFCSENAISSDTPAPHKKTIYKYLQGLQHKSDKNSRAKPAS